jgi:integrase/recombinase XerD
MMLEELQRRNYSEITTRKYLRVVSDFAKHFGKTPDKLGPNELRTYQAYLLRERKLTPGTAVNCVAALRFFFVKTLKRHQFREFLPYPKDRRRLPTVLSREEVARLINAAGTLFRRTLLITLYGTGMRRAELARLKVTDIDSQRMIIRVVEGKGGKDRDLPLSPALLETLREYWRWRKPKTYLFPSRDPRRGPQQPISDKSVWIACQEAARHAGLNKRITPHTLRHSWATRWRRAPTCAPSRFYSGMATWRPPPSICICRSATCRRSPIPWTASLCPAIKTSAAPLNGRTKNDAAHPRGGRHPTRTGRSLPGSVPIEL